MQSNEEIWKDVPNYEGHYKVSNLGNVKSVDREVTSFNPHKGYYKRLKKSRYIKPYLNNGYLKLTLSNNGKKKLVMIHQLVARAFFGISKLQIDHINGVKTDNRVVNLRYCTHHENLIFHWSKNRSGLKSKNIGVTKRANRWEARICINNKQKSLGYFGTEDEAGEAYNKYYLNHNESQNV